MAFTLAGLRAQGKTSLEAAPKTNHIESGITQDFSGEPKNNTAQIGLNLAAPVTSALQENRLNADRSDLAQQSIRASFGIPAIGTICTRRQLCHSHFIELFDLQPFEFLDKSGAFHFEQLGCLHLIAAGLI